MRDKVCLIIDDNLSRVESTLENVVQYGLKNGIEIKFIRFNPTRREFQSNEDGSILKDDLKAFLHKNVLKGKIDLIACDYQLDKSLTGIDIVKIIRERRKTNIFLYSGRIEKIVTDILNKNKEENNTKTVLESISTLVEKGICDFVENDLNKLEQALIRHIKKPNSLDDLFENKLSENHEDLVFKSIYPNFKDKKISEILAIISSNDDSSENFKVELVSQLVDFMVRLN